MNPTCERCGGRCCLVFFLRVDENEELAEWLRARADSCSGDSIVFNHVCPKFANGKCLIYDKRPAACREAPVGDMRCRFAIAHTGGNLDEILGIVDDETHKVCEHKH